MPGHLMRAPALPVPQFSLASLDSRAQNSTSQSFDADADAYGLSSFGTTYVCI